jgi:hypothetical protein
MIGSCFAETFLAAVRPTLLGFLFLILGESEPDYDLEAPLISEPELV